MSRVGAVPPLVAMLAGLIGCGDDGRSSGGSAETTVGASSESADSDTTASETSATSSSSSSTAETTSSGVDESSSSDSGDSSGSTTGAPVCDETVDHATDPDHCGLCGHSCLGGECIASVCQPVLLADLSEIADWAPRFAFDDTHVWILVRSLQDPAMLELWNMPKDGGALELQEVEIPVDAGFGSYAWPNAVHVDETRVYWAMNGPYPVRSWPKGGGAADSYDAESESSYGLTTANGFLYWLDDAGVVRAPADDSGPTELVRAGTQSHPLLRDDDGLVFLDEDGSIIRTDFDGENEILLVGMMQQWRQIRLSGGLVYWWGGNDIPLHRVPVNDGLIELVHEQPWWVAGANDEWVFLWEHVSVDYDFVDTRLHRKRVDLQGETEWIADLGTSYDPLTDGESIYYLQMTSSLTMPRLYRIAW